MNIKMNEVVAGVKLSKVCSIKADKDSEEVKQITLVVNFDGVTLQSVFDKAVAGAVIAWQNGQGRKNFDTYKNGQTIEVQFAAPASKAQVDPMTVIIANAKAAGLSVEQYVVEELKKRQA